MGGDYLINALSSRLCSNSLPGSYTLRPFVSKMVEIVFRLATRDEFVIIRPVTNGAVAQRQSKGLISPGSVVQVHPAPLNQIGYQGRPLGRSLFFETW